MFNWEQERSFSLDWELVIRDHSDDLNQLWGRIHGFRRCINPRRTRGSQLGREKQRDESVKARRNVRKSYLLPLVLQNFRRAFPAKLLIDCPWVSVVPRVAATLESEKTLGRRLSQRRKQNQAFCCNLFEQENVAGNRL